MTPNLYDLSSAQGVRQIVAALFQGYNYRLYTEGQTRNQLLDTYQQLIAIRRWLPADADHAEWMAAVGAELDQGSNDLAWWLLGLTNKTAQNLGVRRDGQLDYLDEVARHIREVSANSADASFDDAMLMLWAGAATLTIRGSRKSTAGKTLERAFLRAGLTLLGMEEGKDFWLNMQRDAEVPREIDVEIASRRGRIRVEMGLIERGNQEVIEDKIERVGTGGMVIFDQIGPRSNARQTAENRQVCFIQIRNNRPLTEIHHFLKERVDLALIEPPADTDGITAVVNGLPDEFSYSVYCRHDLQLYLARIFGFPCQVKVIDGAGHQHLFEVEIAVVNQCFPGVHGDYLFAIFGDVHHLTVRKGRTADVSIVTVSHGRHLHIFRGRRIIPLPCLVCSSRSPPIYCTH